MCPLLKKQISPLSYNTNIIAYIIRKNYSMHMTADYLSESYNFRDPLIYEQVVLSLEKIFSVHHQELTKITWFAQKIQEGFQRIDTFIRQANQNVCPLCKDVCCIRKHGHYTYEDLVYLSALGLRAPHLIVGGNDRDPCPYLLETGCSIERSRRPSHCNWYFCDSLLDYIEPQSTYREFDDSLRDVAELWIGMVEEFRKFSAPLSVQCNHAKTDRCHCRQAECRQIDPF
jgi:rRNA-processing protein FCF1